MSKQLKLSTPPSPLDLYKQSIKEALEEFLHHMYQIRMAVENDMALSPIEAKQLSRDCRGIEDGIKYFQ